MKLAAVYAIASLAKEPTFDTNHSGKNNYLVFGKDYIIPRPYDSKLIHTVSTAVAIAAIESGVARIKIEDWDSYSNGLISRVENHKTYA